MKFQIATAALAATAAAAPNLRVIRQNNGTVPDGTPFNMVSIRSGSNLQYASFSAEQGGLGLNVKEQGATCSNGAEREYATFFLSQGELNLYTPGNVTQKLYVDRSGMGQGVLGYTTSPGGYGPGRNSETKGWVIDQYGDLTFAGAGFLACPSFDGAYSVWVSAGVAAPGGISNCTGIAVRTTVANEPVACTYSYTPATKY
ncbi:hypothetical protein KVR01_011841 [Diaporthe batatas]|uniref:uncharacterized protein n=1 Tax=Diaporthe batatas TaxID=748121 RepID=UPI001D043C83|nr:uncharacterized protein KVR01_011841 [Diaporthe batatas]KAG8158080.1 hypothetical protein KVR01_011841 [Diaporthe batatas]